MINVYVIICNIRPNNIRYIRSNTYSYGHAYIYIGCLKDLFTVWSFLRKWHNQLEPKITNLNKEYKESIYYKCKLSIFCLAFFLQISKPCWHRDAIESKAAISIWINIIFSCIISLYKFQRLLLALSRIIYHLNRPTRKKLKRWCPTNKTDVKTNFIYRNGKRCRWRRLVLGKKSPWFCGV